MSPKHDEGLPLSRTQRTVRKELNKLLPPLIDELERLAEPDDEHTYTSADVLRARLRALADTYRKELL